MVVTGYMAFGLLLCHIERVNQYVGTEDSGDLTCLHTVRMMELEILMCCYRRVDFSSGSLFVSLL